DPNAASTFEASRAPWPAGDDALAGAWLAWFGGLLALRARELVPHLDQARPLGGRVIGESAVAAGWQLGATRWWIELNLGRTTLPSALPPGSDLLRTGPMEEGELPPDRLRVRRVGP